MSNAIIISRKQLESGEYHLVGKVATKVAGDISEHINGASTPIYVVSDKELADGDFKVAAGRPVRMTATRSSRQIKGRKAMPVYVVSGTMASAAWLPEDGLPDSFKMPLARFDFMSTNLEPGSMVMSVQALFSSHVLTQLSVLRAPWMSGHGIMTHNCGLIVPKDLVGMTVVTDEGGWASTSQLMGLWGGHNDPVREIIVYPSLTGEEVRILADYIRHK